FVGRGRQPETPQVSAPGVHEPVAGRRAPEAVPRGPGEARRPAIASNSSGINSISTYLSSDKMQPERFTLDGLGLETGRGALTGDGKKVTDDLASLLKAHPEAKVTVEGFTDATGDTAANRDLSLARAREVRSRLIDQGVDSDRIAAAGLGSSKPIASNDTEEG